ncbi:MAG TPA: MFS transporter [Thermodesulfobacteriota bacterium]
MPSTSRLAPDGRRLLAAAFVRNAAYSALSIALGPYLEALGLGAAEIGWVFTAALAGSATMTVLVAAIADRVGRRRVLVAGAALMALGGAMFGVAASPALLAAAAVLAAINPAGRELGPFLTVEMAALPQTTTDEGRTGAFAAYNVVGTLAVALGSLAAGLPALAGLEGLAAHRALVAAYAVAGLALVALFARLTPAVEAPAAAPGGRRPGAWLGIHRSRRRVLGLSALFALDAFGGGFIVQSLMAYWFALRFGLDTATLGAIFFGANLSAAVSYFAAAPIARRIGLLNTMVFTHLPSNGLLVLVAFMPTAESAVAVLLLRFLCSQLDLPTRQSYLMAVVAPDERSAAAGLTGVARNVAYAVAPVFTSATLAVPALGLPFILAGVIKGLYDVLLLFTFRRVKPPEELR